MKKISFFIFLSISCLSFFYSVIEAKSENMVSVKMTIPDTDDAILSKIETYSIKVSISKTTGEFEEYIRSDDLKSAVELEFFRNGLKVSDDPNKCEFWNFFEIAITPLKINDFEWAISYNVQLYAMGALLFQPKKRTEIFLCGRPIQAYHDGGVLVYGNQTLKSGALKTTILETVQSFIATTLKARNK